MTGRKVVWIFPLLVHSGNCLACICGRRPCGRRKPLDHREADLASHRRVVLIVLFAWLLKAPWSVFFDRKTEIQRDLEEAQAQRDTPKGLSKNTRSNWQAWQKNLISCGHEMKKACREREQQGHRKRAPDVQSYDRDSQTCCRSGGQKGQGTLGLRPVGMAVQMAKPLSEKRSPMRIERRLSSDYLVKVGGVK